MKISVKKVNKKKVIIMFVNSLSICLFAGLVGYIVGLERGDLEKYGPFQNALNSRILSCK